MRDDMSAGANAGARHALGEDLGTGQGMTSGALTARRRQISVHVHEHRAGNVSLQIRIPSLVLLEQGPAHVRDPDTGIAQASGQPLGRDQQWNVHQSS
jgi:hypothetical protein